jgi:signal transduction histidine kinase
VSQPTVVIVSDDPEFSGALSARWQSERAVPSFTLMSGDLCEGLDPESFDLAMVGSVTPSLFQGVLRTLDQSGRTTLLLSDEGDAGWEIAEGFPHIRVVRRHDGWPDTLVLMGSEVLRRCEAAARLRRVEQQNALLERQAALGRYLTDMRHNLNNALTSVLGNAELLLGEPDSPSARRQTQVETIRNMALRMHEILQRLSSLDNELSVVARQAERDGVRQARTAASSR